MAGMSTSGLRRIRSEEKGWDNVSEMDYYICFVEEGNELITISDLWPTTTYWFSMKESFSALDVLRYE